MDTFMYIQGDYKLKSICLDNEFKKSALTNALNFGVHTILTMGI